MKNPQLLNTILIIIGSSGLAYHLISGDENVIIQVGGIILLMVGAYRASVYWSKHKDDHLDDQD